MHIRFVTDYAIWLMRYGAERIASLSTLVSMERYIASCAPYVAREIVHHLMRGS